jgi:hypothetical protein
MKDNTLLPGEWCGGQLHPHPLAQSGDTKSYKIVLMVGADRHEIEIMQGNAQYRGGGMEQLIEAKTYSAASRLAHHDGRPSSGL